MRARGYARCSTEEQGRSGLGLEAQQAAIAAACEQRGWTLTGIEVDVISSGKHNRPGFMRALAALDDGSADVVVSSRLDRMSRSVPEFSDLLARYPGKLVPLDIGIDPGTIAGEFTATVVAAAAQMERRLVSARTRDALQAARERGIRLGRPREMSAAAVSRVRDLAALGLSSAEIARRLNREAVPTPTGRGRWHPPGVRRALSYVA
jgi:DNA invertase Pin-like site-specific DNA recombinase